MTPSRPLGVARGLLLAALLCAGLAAPVRPSAATPVKLLSPADNAICMACHAKRDLARTTADGRTLSLHVDAADLAASAHKGRMCTDCHDDVREIPHAESIARVNCRRCHYVDKIVGATFAEKSAQYRESVHKAALERGNARAPTCQDCHGAHRVLPPTDPASPINRSEIPATCGRCHLAIYSDYRESVHGRALRQGSPDVPICTDCHGEHNIRAVDDVNSSVNPRGVVRTCSHCHAAEGIMAKYGVPTEQYYTYRESYHGVANQYGSTTVANCASCHTAHDCRPSADPLSSVHVNNLPRTCGKCHRGANPNFAKGKIHVVVSREASPMLYYISSGFKWLTILTMCALVGHIALDLLRRHRSRPTR